MVSVRARVSITVSVMVGVRVCVVLRSGQGCD